MNNKIFIDESIHDSYGFLLGAYVFTDKPLFNRGIEKALMNAGLTPYLDEFKSSLSIDKNKNVIPLKEEFYNILFYNTKIGFIVDNINNRDNFGLEVLKGLESLINKNNLGENIEVFFDQGIIKDRDLKYFNSVCNLLKSNVKLKTEQDSKKVLGIQLADYAANSISQILIAELTNKPKMIYREEDGYGEEINLGWRFKMIFRYNFLGDITGSIDEPFKNVFEKGVYLSGTLSDKIKDMVNLQFEKIWMGCAH